MHLSLCLGSLKEFRSRLICKKILQKLIKNRVFLSAFFIMTESNTFIASLTEYIYLYPRLLAAEFVLKLATLSLNAK
jgi:hypothetical protein